MNEAVAGASSAERPRSRERTLALVGGVALVLASAGLFLVSRGKWSDAIIDSGREWIVPDALARGELLYRDVVYWFGPFTPYLHAAFFAVFGSSFRTLVIAGVFGSLAVLAALYFALGAVTGRREAALWTALAVPALVFMPNAGGPILGMGYRIWHAAAFALAAIGVAARVGATPRPIPRAAAVGLLCGLAGLCRTEWGVVSLLAAWLAFALRSRARRRLLRDAAVASATFAVVFGGALAFFVLKAGWKAVIEDNHLLLTGLPPETREFVVAFSGIRDWKKGIAEMVYSSAMWLGVFFLMDLASSIRGETAELGRRAPWLAGLLGLLGVSALMGGAGGAVIFSAAPLVCLIGLVIGLRRRRGARAAALAAIGLLGVLLSYRRPFHITDSAYVGPPLLFAFVSAAGLLRLAVRRRKLRVTRERLRSSLAGALAVLTVLTFASRAVRYDQDPRIPIPRTEQMLSAHLELVRELDLLSAAIRRQTRDGDGLVVFPEGEIVNYLSKRRNPIRHKLYLPGYVDSSNEDEIVTELSRMAPAAIVLWNRRTSEYGKGAFGIDHGRQIWGWITRHYSLRSSTAETAARRRHPSFEYGLRVAATERPSDR